MIAGYFVNSRTLSYLLSPRGDCSRGHLQGLSAGAYLPKRLDPRRERQVPSVEHCAGVDDDKGDRQTHGEEHDAEAGTDADEFDDAEVVLPFDGVEERARREDPPGVASTLISAR